MTDTFVAGARFGRYTLLRQIAVGGMAEIYLARIDGIGSFAKHVVLKRILSQFARNEEFVEMFLHEARLAAGLQHPNVVQVFDIGEIDGNYFFTMEYVQGHDLRSLLKATIQRGERIPLQYAIAFVSDAAAGLHYAHEQVDEAGSPLAIVHRDVSPSNIMVSFDGAVKVADFGIAKAASQTIETRTGTLKGKVSYMSPEQCRGDALDRRSDVFALGIVLHELVTGKKLYQADNDYAIIRKIVEQDAPGLADVAPGDYPAELERIVAKALARDRDARYATAEQLQVDLETLARAQQLDGTSVARARYLRSVLGTPPAGIPIEKTPPSDEASSVPTTARKRRGKVTESTSIETPASAKPGKRSATKWLVGGSALVAASLTATWVATRDDSPPVIESPAPRATIAEPPTPIEVPDAAIATAPATDAATPTPTVALPAPTPTTPPKPRPTPKVPVDPCRGWDPNSLEPVPDGCDPTNRNR